MTSPRQASVRGDIYWAGVVCMFAIAVRVLFLAWSQKHDALFLWPVVDETTYLSDALTIADAPLERGSYRLPFWQPPGYTLILALLLKSGMTLKGIVILQQALGVCSACLIFILGLKCFGRKARAWAFLGALLFAACPAVLFYETRFLKPAWNIFGLLLLLLAFASQRRARYSIPLGLLMGGLCLLEAYFIIIPMLFPILLMKENARAGLVSMAVAFAVMAPVAVGNTWAAKKFVPLSRNGGLNLYIGNNPQWTATYNTLPSWDWKMLADRQEPYFREHGLAPVASGGSFYREVLSFALKRPHVFIRNLIIKGMMTFSPTKTYRDMHMFADNRLARLGFAVNAAIFILFAVASPRAAQRAKLPMLIVLLLAFINTVFFPATRYRLPMLAAMCVTIGGVHQAAKQWKTLASVGVALAIMTAGAFFVARCFDRQAWRALREVATAEKLVLQGRLAEADQMFAAAISTKPILSALQRYGEFLLGKANDPERAFDYFVQASQVSPHYPDPHYYMAAIQKEKRAYNKAYASYSRYIDLRERVEFPEHHDSGMLLEALSFCAAHQSMHPETVFAFDASQKLETLVQKNAPAWQNEHGKNSFHNRPDNPIIQRHEKSHSTFPHHGKK
ncbi:MAG TPA: hypothetical protein GX689_02695 [Lentisphaerae bacterium]|nr:hypothetical protein [Lentisphaerota bacterium]